ncbi:hypothetical protein BLNAU_8474 [Blattamonas nauphoetae]|uniref:Uncharacterized protein n=1 Tax=Blattamonas nauphoetae TaxID=2049346 RepID=A0ABQ9XYT6_9EUKA|nr:hypothetical protein BLNAU_8474 [Blattamonas nauphoetae]
MQASPKKEIVSSHQLTNEHAQIQPKKQVQFPECREDVREIIHRYPLLVWYDPLASKGSEDSLLEHENLKTVTSLVTSKCESREKIEWNDLMEWFVCAVIGLYSKASCCNNSFWFDWDDVLVDGFGTARITRLTDTKFNLNSPQFHNFKQILDPEFDMLNNKYDPVLFEEAKWISSWKEFLHKTGRGKTVETDASLAPSEVPTTGFVVGWVSGQFGIVSTFIALFSQHLPRSTPRLFSSDNLIFGSINVGQVLPSIHLNLDPTELFDSSLFDEPDNEKLARSLVRCRSVCELVGAEKCIRNFPDFINRTASVLHTSDSSLRKAAYHLICCFVIDVYAIPLLPDLWTRLRFSFRDGHLEEQFALIQVSTHWILHSGKALSHQPFPAKEFDWDGLMKADLRISQDLTEHLLLLLLLRKSSIKDKITRAESTDIIFSFEQHQNAVSKIVSFFEFAPQMAGEIYRYPPAVSYCLLLSLLSHREFPPTLTTFLTKHVELDIQIILKVLSENKVILFCHNSLNRHTPHPPPLDFIFERAIRTCPLDFFLHSPTPDVVISTFLPNTALCGFHSLCRRGVHCDLMENERVKRGEHVVNSIWLFSTQFISDTFHLFLLFPPSLVVRFFLPILFSESTPSHFIDPLRVILLTLLVVTAPFGDCSSLKELHRSVNQHITNHDDSSQESFITSHCMSLEWLNIPTGFESALAHSNKHLLVDTNEGQTTPRISPDESHELSKFHTTLPAFLSAMVVNTRNRIHLTGGLVRDLNLDGAPLLVFEDGTLLFLCNSPIPADVSVVLEFVKRAVHLGSVENVMEMVRLGMIDSVIRAVSESSFLEDYENGVCVIGILLRSIRDTGKKQEMKNHNFCRLLSQIGLS